MAMGIHAPAPIPILRRGPCPSSPLSSGFSCVSYRWHSVDCAVSSEPYDGVPDYNTSRLQCHDRDWLNDAKFQRERTRRFQERHTAATDSQQGRCYGSLLSIADKGQESREEHGDARSPFEINEPDEMSVGSRRGAEPFTRRKMHETRLWAYSSPTKSTYWEADGSEHVDPSRTSSNVGVLDCPSRPFHPEGNASSRIWREQQSDSVITMCRASVYQDENAHGPGVIVATEPRDGANCTDHLTKASRPHDTMDVSSLLSKGSMESTEVAPTGGDFSNELIENSTLPSSEPIPSGSKVAQVACEIEDVLLVTDLDTARRVVDRLRGEYKAFVHACDTEVSDIDVKKQSPVGHGTMICFSIYCGPEADFGDGKSCVWVDVLDSNKGLLDVFKEYFEDSSIKKVWHNYSFDRHILANHRIKAAGFYADTMHLARLWHSGRKGAEGGYSLESLTSDIEVMNGVHKWDTQTLTKKTSMMELFGTKKLKKDGTEGSVRYIPPVEELQRSKNLREKWVCYSSGDALCTWRLWESLHKKLEDRKWFFQAEERGSMYSFYSKFWKPFGDLLAEMEGYGMLVDRDYLAEIEKIACKERAVSISRFRKWAAKYCPYAQYINVTSDTQIRQLLFGGFKKVSKSRSFKVPNVDGYIEAGKKAPLKYRSIEISGIGVNLPCETVTASGLPTVSIQSLKNLAGKVSIDGSEMEEEEGFIPEEPDVVLTSAGIEGVNESKQEDLSVYGAAYHAFKGGQEGKEACKAITALCEVSAIETLITSFITPLQGGDIMGLDGRVHCSLNLNTETGRLSARRPNLQNQPALEKDRYKIRQAFIASPGNSLIVADYGQLELRLLAHLADCKSMLEAFKIGGDFHSRTAMNMYDNVKKAVERGEVLLEWEHKAGESFPPRPLLKDVFGAERRKAKMLNFSIAYGKTAKGLAKDWKVSLQEAQETLNLWYRDRPEVRKWQETQKKLARETQCVFTLLGRPRHFPNVISSNEFVKGRVDRAAINTPVQGSAADVAMLAMLELSRNTELKELGWRLLLQVHDEMILEGPTDSAAYAKELVVRAMSHPFQGKNILNVDLAVDAKYANSWYAAK